MNYFFLDLLKTVDAAIFELSNSEEKQKLLSKLEEYSWNKHDVTINDIKKELLMLLESTYPKLTVPFYGWILHFGIYF